MQMKLMKTMSSEMNSTYSYNQLNDYTNYNIPIKCLVIMIKYDAIHYYVIIQWAIWMHKELCKKQ